MKRTTKLAIATAVSSITGVISCDGGPGGLAFEHGSWDTDHGNLSQRERPVGGTADPARTSEQAPDRLPDDENETPPSRGGGGTGGPTFVCNGIFECIVSGPTQTCVTSQSGTTCTPGQFVTARVRISLKEVGGRCFAGEAELLPNGTFRGEDDDEVGTWRREGEGFYIRVGEASGICVPSSGPVGLVGIESDESDGARTGSGSGSGSSDGNGDVSIDPGTGQDGTSSSGGQ